MTISSAAGRSFNLWRRLAVGSNHSIDQRQHTIHPTRQFGVVRHENDCRAIVIADGIERRQDCRA